MDLIFTTTSYIPVIINLSLLFLYCSNFKILNVVTIGQNVITIKILNSLQNSSVPTKTLCKNLGLFTLSLKSNHRTTHPNTLYRILPHSHLRTLAARTTKPPSSSPAPVQQSSDNLILPHSLPHSPSHSVGLAFYRQHHHYQQHSHCGHPRTSSLPHHYLFIQLVQFPFFFVISFSLN